MSRPFTVRVALCQVRAPEWHGAVTSQFAPQITRLPPPIRTTVFINVPGVDSLVDDVLREAVKVHGLMAQSQNRRVEDLAKYGLLKYTFQQDDVRNDKTATSSTIVDETAGCVLLRPAKTLREYGVDNFQLLVLACLADDVDQPN